MYRWCLYFLVCINEKNPLVRSTHDQEECFLAKKFEQNLTLELLGSECFTSCLPKAK